MIKSNKEEHYKTMYSSYFSINTNTNIANIKDTYRSHFTVIMSVITIKISKSFSKI